MATSERLNGHHKSLCERAASWLRGSMRCDPVLYGIASTAEIPDAIGWSSHGSIVVECKVSIEDFLRDKRKNHADQRMGDRRYFMTPFGMIDSEYAAKHFPDHGLIQPNGKRDRDPQLVHLLSNVIEYLISRELQPVTDSPQRFQSPLLKLWTFVDRCEERADVRCS